MKSPRGKFARDLPESEYWGEKSVKTAPALIKYELKQRGESFELKMKFMKA